MNFKEKLIKAYASIGVGDTTLVNGNPYPEWKRDLEFFLSENPSARSEIVLMGVPVSAARPIVKLTKTSTPITVVPKVTPSPDEVIPEESVEEPSSYSFIDNFNLKPENEQ
jgi:hypothetical protein